MTITNTAHSLMTGDLSPVESVDASEAAASEAAEAAASENPVEEEAVAVAPTKINFLKDETCEMTYGRRIALSLMKYNWYYPQPEGEEGSGDDDDDDDDKESSSHHDDTMESPPPVVDDFDKHIIFEKPCLKRGWAFFEHQALYRFLLPPDYKEKENYSVATKIYRSIFKHREKDFKRAEPGEDEDPSRLYPAMTPHNQLGDFGLGIGLYFSNLRALIFISILCGCISLGNILYFASDKYDPNDGLEQITFRTLAIAGSAACSSQVWVPCPDCNCGVRGDGHSELTLNLDRCAISTVNNETHVFALKNDCDYDTYMLAASNFATVAVMVLCMFLLGRFMRKEEIKFDEDEQTAQDYSVQIKNPPPDAKNPEEWRTFFKENFDGAEVVVCTCAVENDLLVKALVERREVVRTIHAMQPEHSTAVLDIAKTAAGIERDRGLMGRIMAKIVPGIPEYYTKLVALKGKVEGLAQLEYPVTNIFVTFETEEAQRRVLKALSVGFKNAAKNNKAAISDPKHLFRGEYVLDVAEPEEPNTIVWENLNASVGKRTKQQIYTFLYTLALLVIVFYIVYAINLKNPIWATYAISFFNVAFPECAKAMTENLETHPSESLLQASLYYKIVLFRWVSTALIFYTIIPFTDTISYGENGLLVRVYLQYFSDITLSNALQLIDIGGNLKRHFLAPRAKTQDAMNILFQGTEYELAERYTDMTKIIFLSVFYCAIFPMAFFLCAISLTFKYFVDRFSLIRTWKRAPSVGPTIASISRKYFLSMAVGIMAIVCSYYWTGFPFDNLCIDEESPVNFTGEFEMEPHPTPYPRFANGFSTPVTTATVSEGDFNYRICSQDFTGHLPRIAFPFVPSRASRIPDLEPADYMTEQQIISTTYFGWSAFAMILVVLGKYVYLWYGAYQATHKGGYVPVGEVQGKPFSKEESRNGYIPQVHSRAFAFPLIACQVDDIDEELFDFKDPSRSYLYYDLTNDAEKLVSAGHENKLDDRTFTIVKSWPAEKKTN